MGLLCVSDKLLLPIAIEYRFNVYCVVYDETGRQSTLVVWLWVFDELSQGLQSACGLHGGILKSFCHGCKGPTSPNIQTNVIPLSWSCVCVCRLYACACAPFSQWATWGHTSVYWDTCLAWKRNDIKRTVFCCVAGWFVGNIATDAFLVGEIYTIARIRFFFLHAKK